MRFHRGNIRVALAIFVATMGGAIATGQTPQKKEIPPELAVRGVLVRKSGSLLFIRADGDQQPRRFDLREPGTIMDPTFAANIKDLALGTLIELSYGRDSAGRRSSNIWILAEPGSFGAMTGIVTDKSDKNGSIDVRDDAGKIESFLPHWRGDGFDKEMLRAIVDVNIGDRVDIHWTKDDHIRVSTLRLLELSEQGKKRLGDAAGTVRGKVVEKGKDWVAIQADGGDKQRYLPQRIIGVKGQLDYDILRTIASLKAGDPVEAGWFRDNERTLYFLKPAAGK
jgi:hypothetical protein